MNSMSTNTVLYRTLARALSIKRPHNTTGSQQMTAWLIEHLPKGQHYHVDAAGNVHVDARKHDKNRTLFVAHVDTVHRVTGPNKIRKTWDTWYAQGAPLGADDGAGCAMLMHLLCAGVGAYYIFTQGEEVGGIGAKYVSDNTDLLKQFDRAIAFDRKGVDSVITHQGMGRCCSDAFAQALSDAFNEDDRLMYLPDDTGVYTDTAEFTGIIPECTNISVGYYSEHTDKEKLDVIHLQALADRCLRIDWDGLATKRDPSVHDSKWGTAEVWDTQSWYTGKDTRSHYTLDDELDYEFYDALEMALVGNKKYLIDLMAEAVYPEEPALARRLINPKALTEKVLYEAENLSQAYTAKEVLTTLFSEAYCEA